jgi:hypothetical protein
MGSVCGDLILTSELCENRQDTLGQDRMLSDVFIENITDRLERQVG